MAHISWPASTSASLKILIIPSKTTSFNLEILIRNLAYQTQPSLHWTIKVLACQHICTIRPSAWCWELDWIMITSRAQAKCVPSKPVVLHGVVSPMVWRLKCISRANLAIWWLLWHRSLMITPQMELAMSTSRASVRIIPTQSFLVLCSSNSSLCSHRLGWMIILPRSTWLFQVITPCRKPTLGTGPWHKTLGVYSNRTLVKLNLSCP